MAEPIPCKHLDYEEGKYGPDIELRTSPHNPVVRFWHRGKTWTDNGPGEKPNPADVQFCGAGRGRINGILQCYLCGEMSCYEPISTPEPQPQTKEHHAENE
jgi:hypothetical protein